MGHYCKTHKKRISTTKCAALVVEMRFGDTILPVWLYPGVVLG